MAQESGVVMFDSSYGKAIIGALYLAAAIVFVIGVATGALIAWVL